MQDVVGISWVISIICRPYGLCVLHVCYSSKWFEDVPHQAPTLRSDGIYHDKNIPHYLVQLFCPNLDLCIISPYNVLFVFRSRHDDQIFMEPMKVGLLLCQNMLPVAQILEFGSEQCSIIKPEVDSVEFILIINESEELKAEILFQINVSYKGLKDWGNMWIAKANKTCNNIDSNENNSTRVHH